MEALTAVLISLAAALGFVALALGGFVIRPPANTWRAESELRSKPVHQ
jgi:hypothetical protein